MKKSLIMAFVIFPMLLFGQELSVTENATRKFALIIGDEEAANESLTIKYMQENKEQCFIKIDELENKFSEL